MRSGWFVLVTSQTLFACGSPGPSSNPDASLSYDAADAAVDAPNCRDTHFVGDSYPAADRCNFCTCNIDGSETCTTHVCAPIEGPACTYAGVEHAYGELFPSADNCNQCVCAASGLACTERAACSPDAEPHAILLESLDAPCGDPSFGFTPRSVLDAVPASTVSAPFTYQHDRELYPEWRQPTQATFTVRYRDGFAVCRIPAENQEAIDLEVVTSLTTADDAFDVAMHTYLRKNRAGFLLGAHTVGSMPTGTNWGQYNQGCPDARGLTIAAMFEPDGAASGSVHKTCEDDIGLEVGTWVLSAP